MRWMICDGCLRWQRLEWIRLQMLRRVLLVLLCVRLLSVLSCSMKPYSRMRLRCCDGPNIMELRLVINAHILELCARVWL